MQSTTFYPTRAALPPALLPKNKETGASNRPAAPSSVRATVPHGATLLYRRPLLTILPVSSTAAATPGYLSDAAMQFLTPPYMDSDRLSSVRTYCNLGRTTAGYYHFASCARPTMASRLMLSAGRLRTWLRPGHQAWIDPRQGAAYV